MVHSECLTVNSDEVINAIVLDLTEKEYDLFNNNQNHKNTLYCDTDVKEAEAVNLSADESCSQNILHSGSIVACSHPSFTAVPLVIL